MTEPVHLVEMLERLMRDQIEARPSPGPTMADGWSPEDALENLATACLRLSRENRRLGEAVEALEGALAASFYRERVAERERDEAVDQALRRLSYALRLRRHVRERFGPRASDLPLT